MSAKLLPFPFQGEAMDQTERLFDKLEDITKSVATTAIDVARIQGTQEGLKTAVDTVASAIGDVNAVKLEARTTSVEIKALSDRMTALERTVQDREKERDRRSWVESIMKGLLLSGGGAGVTLAVQKLF